MNATDIARAIITSNYSADELQLITNALVFAKSHKTQVNTGSMVIGTAVQFKSRNFGVVKGMVTKVNRKFILVRANNTVYRVPAALLERV